MHVRRREQDMGRRVSAEFPVPKWLNKRGDFQIPYEFEASYDGKYGVVNYDVAGAPDGRLVICFHGLNGSRGTFGELQKTLICYGCLVLSFDLYGHGLSASTRYKGDRYSLDFFCDQTDDLLQHLDLQDYPRSLVGFSMGCVVAAGFALRRPELVEKMVLISPAGMVTAKARAVGLARRCRCCVPCANQCLCRCCFSAKRFQKIIPGDPVMAKTMYNRTLFHIFVKRKAADAFIGSVLGVPLWDAEPLYNELGRLALPTLIIWGGRDQVVDVSTSSTLMHHFSNAHLVVFRDAHHLVISEKAAEVNALVMTMMQFPNAVPIKLWSYFLPMSGKGEYIPPSHRHPPGFTAAAFHSYMHFDPLWSVEFKTR